MPENLEKYRSTELYDAPLEGSTIFLYRSSTSRTPLDSSGLAELKYAFFCRAGRNTKKLRLWNRCEKFGPGFNSCTKAVLSASPGPTPRRCEPQLFLAALGQVIRCSKAVDLGSLNMQFEHDWPKDKKLQLF